MSLKDSTRTSVYNSVIAICYKYKRPRQDDQRKEKQIPITVKLNSNGSLEHNE